MTTRRIVIAAALALIAYQIWRVSKREKKREGYCLGGVWIPPGAGKPFTKDGKLYYCPDGDGCEDGMVEVDIENVDKRCL